MSSCKMRLLECVNLLLVMLEIELLLSYREHRA